jgi:hypothetical protein
MYSVEVKSRGKTMQKVMARGGVGIEASMMPSSLSMMRTQKYCQMPQQRDFMLWFKLPSVAILFFPGSSKMPSWVRFYLIVLGNLAHSSPYIDVSKDRCCDICNPDSSTMFAQANQSEP